MSREIDKEIAEKLFDKEVFEKDGQWYTRGSEGFVCYLKRYSEYIVDAWEVVEKIIEQLFSVRRKFIFNIQVLISEALGMTDIIHVSQILFYLTPEIICKAALKAIDE